MDMDGRMDGWMAVHDEAPAMIPGTGNRARVGVVGSLYTTTIVL